MIRYTAHSCPNPIFLNLLAQIQFDSILIFPRNPIDDSHFSKLITYFLGNS